MPANHKSKILPLILLLIVVCSGTALAQQTTAFTYQGSLSPAGTYNLQFALFGSSSGGVPIGTQTFPNVNVSGGTFTVVLDFGASAFPGADRWLETTVNSNTLSPRVQITSVPYAIRALNGGGPITGSDPTTMFSVTNTQAGVTNPSYPANVPPAAIRGEATSSVNSSAGLLGISAGSFGFGIAGISSGTPGANDNPAGVFGQALGTSGKTRGVVGSIRSPNGIAVHALSTGGNLFEGASGSPGSEISKFSVDGAGNVTAQGTLQVAGSLSAFSVNTATLVPVGAIVTNAGNLAVSGSLAVSGGCTGCNPPSDRNLKANFSTVNPRFVLNKLAGIPIQTWNYKSESADVRHIGAMAQDFRLAFGFGENDKTLNTVDANGVAMAAIQGLYQMMLEKDTKIQHQSSQIEQQSRRIEQLQVRLGRLEGAVKKTRAGRKHTKR